MWEEELGLASSLGIWLIVILWPADSETRETVVLNNTLKGLLL